MRKRDKKDKLIGIFNLENQKTTWWETKVNVINHFRLEGFSVKKLVQAGGQEAENCLTTGRRSSFLCVEQELILAK
jgi:hypothetical protein